MESIETNQTKQSEDVKIRRRGIDNAFPSEKVVIDWLQKQDYRTKLACYIMFYWHLADHGTDYIINELIDNWETEILDNARNPENLKPDETVLTGLAVELIVSKENM